MSDNEELENEEFQDELKPGTKLLGGQYTITKFLNSGGFGITYLAKDSLDRDVVIKECFPSSISRRSNSIVRPRSRAHQSSFGSVVELFVKEARNQAKLEHPNIAGVHQVFNDNDTAYMAIDFIDGRDLLDTIEDRSAVTPKNVEYWLRKTLDAIGFIHENGMLHRDISPDNILISPDNEPILIDFGAARESASQSNRALSTLRVVKDGYSPQEFYVQGSEQNPSSDLYALAATFYHVVSGDAPKDSQTRLAGIAQDGTDTYTPLYGNITGFPDNLLKSIDKALNVLPADRCKSAEEWIGILDGTTAIDASTKASGRNNSSGEGSKSKSKMIALLGAVSVAAIIGIYVLDIDLGISKEAQVETPAVPQETAQIKDTPAVPDEPTETVTAEPVDNAANEPEAKPVENTGTNVTLSSFVAAQGWAAELPFQTLPSPQTQGTFARVISTKPNLSVNAAEWLKAGSLIYSVNGTLVADDATISKAVVGDKIIEFTNSLDAEMRIRTGNDDKVENHTMSFDVGYETKLKNGMRFMASKSGEAWITRATAVPTSLNSALKVGDIIHSEAVTRSTFSSSDAINQMLVKIEGSKSAFLTVSRNGILESVNLSLK